MRSALHTCRVGSMTTCLNSQLRKSSKLDAPEPVALFFLGVDANCDVDTVEDVRSMDLCCCSRPFRPVPG